MNSFKLELWSPASLVGPVIIPGMGPKSWVLEGSAASGNSSGNHGLSQNLDYGDDKGSPKFLILGNWQPLGQENYRVMARPQEFRVPGFPLGNQGLRLTKRWIAITGFFPQFRSKDGGFRKRQV